LFSEYLRGYQHGMLRCGCPVGSLANEIAMQSPSLLEETNKVFNYLWDGWTSVVQRGQKDGQIGSDVPARELSRMATMLVQGAFLVTKCSADFTPMRLAHSAIHSLLFASDTKSQPKLIHYNESEMMSRAS
jgi:hypothetical protein